MKKANNGHGTVTVKDSNGRKGKAYYEGGYLLGGSYVNPSWRIVWEAEDE